MAPETADTTSEDAMWAEMAALRAGRGNPAPEHSPDIAAPDEDDAPEPEFAPAGPAEGDEPDTASDDADDADKEQPPARPTPEGKAKADAPAPDAHQAQVKRLEQRLSDMGRERAAQRREIEALQRRLAEAGEPAKTADDETRRKRREQLERARADYPDLIGPLAEQLDELDRREQDRAAAHTRALEADRAEFARFTSQQEAAFKREHPDGFDVLEANADAFRDWIEDQPKRLRDLFEANREHIVDGEGAALLIASFKQALGAAASADAPDPQGTDPHTTARRQRQLAGAKALRSAPNPRGSSAPPREADDDAQWEYVKALRARRNR